jgi:hypothetical protein
MRANLATRCLRRRAVGAPISSVATDLVLMMLETARLKGGARECEIPITHPLARAILGLRFGGWEATYRAGQHRVPSIDASAAPTTSTYRPSGKWNQELLGPPGHAKAAQSGHYPRASPCVSAIPIIANVSGTAREKSRPAHMRFFSKKLEGVLENREGREFSKARAWGVYS